MIKSSLNRGILYILLTIAVMQIFSVKVHAEEKLEDSTEYNEIVALTDKILQVANSCYYNLGEFADEDINYNQAVKDYLVDDIFQYELLSEDKINEILEESRHVWLIPLYAENAIIWVTVARNLDFDEDSVRGYISDERIAEMKASIGDWDVTEITMQDGTVTYKDKIKKVINESFSEEVDNINIAFLGGTPKFNSYFYLINLGEDETYIYPVSESIYAYEEGTLVSENYAAKQEREYAVYRFEDLQYEASKIKDPPKGEIYIGSGSLDIYNVEPATIVKKGANNESNTLILCIGILGICGIAGALFYRYSKYNNKSI